MQARGCNRGTKTHRARDEKLEDADDRRAQIRQNQASHSQATQPEK